MTLHTTVYS